MSPVRQKVLLEVAACPVVLITMVIMLSPSFRTVYGSQ